MSEPVQPEEDNPYEAPREPEASNPKELIFVEEDSPEVQRKTYGAREASVRVIGLYYFLMAGSGMLHAVLALASPRFTQEIANRSPPGTVIPMVFVKAMMVFAGLIGGTIDIVLGFFLRRLHKWARWVAIVISAIGILSEIASLLINGIAFGLEPAELVFDAIFSSYIIIILISRETRIIMSHQYRQIVVQTPEIDPQPSMRDWVFLGTATAFYLVWFLIQLGRAVA